MKKLNFGRIITLVLAVFMLSVSVGCGNKADAIDNNENGMLQEETQNGGSDSKGQWGIKLNGKSITLPCTLADLAKIDVNLYSEFEKETILNSTNETFIMIGATYGEDLNLIHLKIVTGNAADKKEANATVKVIVNSLVDRSMFELKGGIALGSSIDDVIKVFGDDYNLSGATDDDIHSGYTVINYGTIDDGIMFSFEDGILGYIEILADEGE